MCLNVKLEVYIVLAASKLTDKNTVMHSQLLQEKQTPSNKSDTKWI